MKYKLLTLFPLLCLCLYGNAQMADMEKNMRIFLQRAAEDGYSGAALVARNGQMLLQEGVGWADPAQKRKETAQTVFSTGSITKQFTAAAIMKLWSAGLLKTSDPLSRYFPEAPQDKAAITIHQLLTHSAGFPGAIGDDYELDDAAAFMKKALAEPLLFPPGERYEYSNVGYSILGILVEKISGKGYEQYLREQLWLPAGMLHTGYVLQAPDPSSLAVGYRDGERWGTALDRPWLSDGPGWHLRANGGVLSTLEDMFLWHKALITNRILPSAATDQMFQKHIPEGPEGRSHYGYGWVIQENDGVLSIWHNGGNGVYNAFMGFEPATGLCIIVSSNNNSVISDDIALQLKNMADGRSEMLEDATIALFNGAYVLPDGGKFRLRLNAMNQLVVQFDNTAAFKAFMALGTEKAADTAPVGDRTLRMLEGIRKQDFSLIARYRDMPAEMAQQRIKPFWEMLQTEHGSIRSFDLIGVASRPQIPAELAFVRVNFEQQPLYFIYLWQGEKIVDVQTMPVMDKIFDWQGGLRFFAPNIRRELILEATPNQPPGLLIQLPDGAIRARKE